jgi:hypothetical protein
MSTHARPTGSPARAHGGLRRRLILGTCLAMLVVVLPVGPVVAHEAAPEVRSETVDEIAEDARAHGAGRESSRSEVIEAPIPFSGMGVQGVGPEPELRVRTREIDGDWSPWTDVEILDEFDGPDPGSAEAARAGDARRTMTWTTDAIWAGEASHAQIDVVKGSVRDLEVTFIDSMGISETRLQRIGRALRSLGTSQPAEAASKPGIISRAQWGANESWRSGSPSYATVRFGVLHHTATSNSYTREQAAGQVRNMYYWHTQNNGWNDLGYNFVVDRFGRIYEGRYGGVDRGVIGAHAGGWNTGSFGVAIMGNHNTVNPSSAAVNAASSLMAWKYRLHGLNPDPTARVSINGHRIRTLEGHRNVRSTYIQESSSSSFAQDCPGSNLYSRMDNIRHAIADKVSATSTSAWVPVTGDWNGDGRETPGWYRDGRWRLSNSTNNNASVDFRFNYGTAGDLPVVGDWNADGTDTVGVFRGGTWHLRNHNSGGAASTSFHYGRSGDTPVVGDWNGSTMDTVGVVRGSAWHLRLWQGGGPANVSFHYGSASDVPLVGNWNGAGVADRPGVRRGNAWYLRNSLSGGGADHAFNYGRASDHPVVANWNGPLAPSVNEGLKSGIGAVRGTDWHARRDASGGAAHASFTFAP